MNPFVGLAISIVPDLMKMFSGEKAGGLPEGIAKNLGDEVTRVVAAATQSSTVDDAARKIQSDPTVKAELQIKLAQIALEAQRAAFDHAERQRQAELAELEKRRQAAFKADQMAMESTEAARRSARDLADTRPLLALTPAALSYVVVVGFLALLLLMSLGLMRLNESDGSILQIFNILIGALAAAFATVINFWLGSSLGSRRKDDVIETQALDTQTLKQERARPITPPEDGGGIE